MKNPDLSDFLHAAGFYAVSVFIAFFAAAFQEGAASSVTFGTMFALYYAFILLAVLSLAGFVLGSVSVYAGILSLKGGNK